MYKEFTKEEIDNVEKEVKEFFNENKIELSPDIDIIKVGKELGFQMLSLSLPQGVDGVIKVGKEGKIIGVSNKTNPQEVRFVIAHELAHYLHKLKMENEEKPMFAMKDSILHGIKKDDNEHLMDLIAATILVPKDYFVQDIKNADIGVVEDIEKAKNVGYAVIKELAEKYNVNADMIVRRIVEVSQYVA